ncbi:MAG: response regulator [Deltaproteobacteria bacterium]|nr:response regulator [Deltaproteobacteria bacterium]
MQKTVLIVDDDAGLSKSVRQVLERQGLQTHTASSVEQALALLKQPIDLILLDLGLPDMSGHALLKSLRDAGRLDLPVIIMSGTGNIEDVIEAMRNRAADYLRKPFFPEQLTAAVDRVLKEHAPRHTPSMMPAAASVWSLDELLTIEERGSVSAREKDILGLLLQGRRAPEMATALGISPHTIRNHLKAIYRKLGVHSQGALAEFLLKRREERERISEP